MSDRSDDIKQLFSHLGLNPGDYQEVRTVRRGAIDVTAALGSAPVRTETFAPPVIPPPMMAQPQVSSAPAGTPAPVIAAPGPLSALPETVAPAPAPTPAPAIPRAPEATYAVPPPAAQVPVMSQRREPMVSRVPSPPPVAATARPMPSVPSDETVRRWALLREVQDRPQTMARIQPELREQRRTTQYSAPAPAPASVPPPAAPAMPAARPWNFDADLAGMARAQPFQRSAASPAAPSEETAEPTMDRLVQAMRRSAVGIADVEQPPMPAQVSPLPVKPIPAVMAAPAPIPPPPMASAPGSASVLSSTFERLARPQPPAATAAGGRLRLNIAPDAVAAHSGGPRVESLGEVFLRISSAGPIAPMRRG